MTACARHKPILVGYSTDLTGTCGEIEVEMRDGAQVAADLIDEQCGINGRPVKLIVIVNKGDPELDSPVDDVFVDQSVVAIIGHVTSGPAIEDL